MIAESQAKSESTKSGDSDEEEEHPEGLDAHCAVDIFVTARWRCPAPMQTCPANPPEQAIMLIVFGGFQTSIACFEGSAAQASCASRCFATP